MSYEIVLSDPGTLNASEGQNFLLPFQEEKQNANFELGVSMIVHAWPTLQTAVDNQWGGANSEEKRDWITGVIIEEFENNKTIDIIYIHELLSGIMEDEFDAVLQDESTVEVGKKVIHCYQECQVGAFDTIKLMYNKWLEKQKYSSKNIVHVENDPLNPDSSDEDGDDAMDEDGDFDMMDDSADDTPKYQAPIVDDDGFTVVSKKGNRR
ncbi:Tsr2 protein [Martiniozyma asiatica (nom. inval.)]|nr:Tsr2 protein [Martiniozyma asiatica]